MWLPELLVPAAEPVDPETGSSLRRRRIVTAVTLVAGTGLLAATLRAVPGSGWFSVLGFLAAAAWITGGLLSGPIPLRQGQSFRLARPAWRTVVLPALAVGILAFLGFLGADLAGQHLAWISGALASVLGQADAGPLAIVLAVALVNGVGEEIFFRGALLAALEPRRAALISTVIYVAVTAATGNLALVVAAAVMGTIFTLERLSTRGILAPITTHLTWSTLTLFLLPR